MAKYYCEVCEVYEYDEFRGDAQTGITPGTSPERFPPEWECPFCLSPASKLKPIPNDTGEPAPPPSLSQLISPPQSEVQRIMALTNKGKHERHMQNIHWQSVHGESEMSAMRTVLAAPSWDSLLFMGAQLHRLPYNEGQPVNLRTVIGPRAKKPLIMEMPMFITHMSYGALSREAKIALSSGSAVCGTAIGSGEGGVLPEELDSAHRYIFEMVPNRYSYEEDVLARVHAVEIKIGQSTSPGMGARLPAEKVVPEIAKIRGYPEYADIISPARYPSANDDSRWLERLVEEIRADTVGIPVGVKMAAGHVEKDIEAALEADVDFITIDGRPGSTASAPLNIKDSFSLPTIVALERSRAKLDQAGADGVSLIITGGLRTSADIAKALAMGADAVALGTAALMAIGCDQYRLCHTGKCPTGITTQDPALRSRLKPDFAAKKLSNYLRVTAAELMMFARMTGVDDIHGLRRDDLVVTDRELAECLDIRFIGDRDYR